MKIALYDKKKQKKAAHNTYFFFYIANLANFKFYIFAILEYVGDIDSVINFFFFVSIFANSPKLNNINTSSWFDEKTKIQPFKLHFYFLQIIFTEQ